MKKIIVFGLILTTVFTIAIMSIPDKYYSANELPPTPIGTNVITGVEVANELPPTPLFVKQA